jgi:arylsulfatase
VTQAPIHGVSFLHTFDDAAASTLHLTQYFEMFGHRAIDHDGWRAVCPWPGASFAEAGGAVFGTPITAEMLGRLDTDGWELYNVAADPAETRDLAAEHRDKLIELISLWYVQAGKYNVLPIDGSALQRAMVERPQIAETRDQYTFWPGTQTVPFFAGPRVLNRPHAIAADATIPDGGAEGVLLCQGSAVGGWTFYVKDGRLHYVHNCVRRAIHRVSSPDPVPEGRHELRFEFEPTGAPDIPSGKGAPGRAQLYVDGDLVAETDMPVTIPIVINPGGLTCGANPGSPVSPDYQAPFRFTGELHTVTVDLSGQLIDDRESELRVAMARQ